MANDLHAWKRLFVLQWHNAASLRVSFLVQVFGMIVNNVGITIAWVLFISVFGTVNGWGAADVIGAQGIGGLTYGLAYTFCHGAVTFGDDIRRGAFDSYFLRPLRILPHVWRSFFAENTMGDMVFGVLMIVIACVLSESAWSVIALALLVSIPGAMIMVAMSTAVNSFAFWNPQDKLIADAFFRVFVTPTMYPAGAFPEALRFIYTFIIPSLLVAGLPWEAARAHAFWIIGAIWLAAFAWMGIAALIFRAGLKRYESGGGVG